MTIIAIDPGDKKSALVHYEPLSKAVIESQYADNEVVLAWLRSSSFLVSPTLAIEMFSSFGMPVGKEVFETCVWIGRFIEAWGVGTQLVYRKDVKLHLCGSARAKDPNVRAALLDRFGGRKARGTKKNPGPLHQIAGDKWSALAVAVTWAEAETRVQRLAADLFAGAA